MSQHFKLLVQRLKGKIDGLMSGEVDLVEWARFIFEIIRRVGALEGTSPRQMML